MSKSIEQKMEDNLQDNQNNLFKSLNHRAKDKELEYYKVKSRVMTEKANYLIRAIGKAGLRYDNMELSEAISNVEQYIQSINSNEINNL